MPSSKPIPIPKSADREKEKEEKRKEKERKVMYDEATWRMYHRITKNRSPLTPSQKWWKELLLLATLKIHQDWEYTNSDDRIQNQGMRRKKQYTLWCYYESHESLEMTHSLAYMKSMPLWKDVLYFTFYVQTLIPSE